MRNNSVKNIHHCKHCKNMQRHQFFYNALQVFLFMFSNMSKIVGIVLQQQVAPSICFKLRHKNVDVVLQIIKELQHWPISHASLGAITRSCLQLKTMSSQNTKISSNIVAKLCNLIALVCPLCFLMRLHLKGNCGENHHPNTVRV